MASALSYSWVYCACSSISSSTVSDPEFSISNSTFLFMMPSASSSSEYSAWNSLSGVIVVTGFCAKSSGTSLSALFPLLISVQPKKFWNCLKNSLTVQCGIFFPMLPWVADTTYMLWHAAGSIDMSIVYPILAATSLAISTSLGHSLT